MALIDSVKDALRIDGTDSNSEISDLIEASKAELVLAGVDKDKITDDDPFVKVAIATYCKGRYNNASEAEPYLASWESMKIQMACSAAYRKAAT